METAGSALAIYGTTEPPPAPVSISCGPLAATIENGALRNLTFDGIEIIRAIDCPIRDVNWGTGIPENIEDRIAEDGVAVVFERRFTVWDEAVSAGLCYRFEPGGKVSATASLRAAKSVQTNRAGLSLLHPLTGVAGHPLTVRHPDGKSEETVFPGRIMPGQPVFDIAGLSHTVSGVDVAIAFEGEVFEMEDQRNWSDASYKTYCRPIGWPLPYAIETGETVTQRILVQASGTPRRPAHATKSSSSRKPARLPEITIASEPWWIPRSAVDGVLEAVDPAGHLIRIDLAAGRLPENLGALALDARNHSRTIDLEIVTGDDARNLGLLAGLANDLEQAGLSPGRVMALPRAYLKSYQPTGAWPKGISPGDALKAARDAFPNASIGCGMLTNFTELNRCRPQADQVDWMTYSSTAIVHAADDRSVLETLETLPQIHDSARVIAGDMPIRLGLASIGMRSNPYGAEIAANPELRRIPMARDDPRHLGLFGAAFAIGAYAAAAAGGCQSIALSSVAGPFGLGTFMDDAFEPFPLFHVVRALARMTGFNPSDTLSLPRGLYGVSARGRSGQTRSLVANCSLDKQNLTLDRETNVRLLDPSTAGDAAKSIDWADTAAPFHADQLELLPYSIAFLSSEQT